MNRHIFKNFSLHHGSAEEERALANALFSSIGNGSITTDDEGRINRVNQVALDILGYKSSDLLGKWFPKAIVALDSDGNLIKPLQRPATRAFLTGKPISKKMYYETKYKRIVPVFVTVSPILINGTPTGSIEVFHDISHEEEIDRMKSEFISIASHQLRTPLTAIKTYTHLLENEYAGKVTAQQKEFLEIILSSADRMNMLVNVLLDISKIESGKLHIVAKKVSLNELANTIIAELHSLADKKNINLTLNLPEEPIIAITDPLLTKEIYVNLISNAIKYTPEKGKVIVSLKLKPSSILFTVKDNGYGIPLTAQSRIFTKFYRAHNVVDKGSSGTGLGLYLVQSMAENMGGKVWFTSREGEGTTFNFSIPRPKLHEDSIKTPISNATHEIT